MTLLACTPRVKNARGTHEPSRLRLPGTAGWRSGYVNAAARLDRSVSLATADYAAMALPTLADIADPQPPADHDYGCGLGRLR